MIALVLVVDLPYDRVAVVKRIRKFSDRKKWKVRIIKQGLQSFDIWFTQGVARFLWVRDRFTVWIAGVRPDWDAFVLSRLAMIFNHFGYTLDRLGADFPPHPGLAALVAQVALASERHSLNDFGVESSPKTMQMAMIEGEIEPEPGPEPEPEPDLSYWKERTIHALIINHLSLDRVTQGSFGTLNCLKANLIWFFATDRGSGVAENYASVNWDDDDCWMTISLSESAYRIYADLDRGVFDFEIISVDLANQIVLLDKLEAFAKEFGYELCRGDGEVKVGRREG